MRESYLGLRYLCNHSQSDRANPKEFPHIPPEGGGALAGRVLNLPGVTIAILPEFPERSAVEYYRSTLGLTLPNIVVPRGSLDVPHLSLALRNNPEAYAAIRDFGDTLYYSVFDPTDLDFEIFKSLRKSGVSVLPEINNFTLAQQLGNKAQFRELCERFDVPQVTGQVVKTVEQLDTVLTKSSREIVVKHPLGTAGEENDFVDGTKKIPDVLKRKWSKWIEEQGAVVIENKVKGAEFAIHLYRHPLTRETIIEGIHRQLVTKTYDERNGVEHFSHIGAITPVTNEREYALLEELGNTKLKGMVEKLDITGPICFDVLYNAELPQSFHVMEAAVKSGANRYARMLALQVAESIFGVTDPANVSSMFLAGLEHNEDSFESFFRKYGDALQPTANSIVVPMSLLGYKYGKCDLLAISVSQAEEVQGVLRKALISLFGSAQSEKLLNSIHNL